MGKLEKIGKEHKFGERLSGGIFPNCEFMKSEEQKHLQCGQHAVRNSLFALGKQYIPRLTSWYGDLRSTIIESWIHKLKMEKTIVVFDDWLELVDPAFFREGGFGLILHNVVNNILPTVLILRTGFVSLEGIGHFISLLIPGLTHENKIQKIQIYDSLNQKNIDAKILDIENFGVETT